MEGPVTSGEMLYGTACPQNQGHGSDQDVSKSYMKTKKKKGNWIRNFFKKAAICCAGGNPPPASHNGKESEEHEEYRLKTMQDHDQDTITATLVGKVGRFDSASYLHFCDTVERQMASDAGLTLRDRGEIALEHEHTLKKQRFSFSPNHTGKKEFLGQRQAGRTLLLSASHCRGDFTFQRTPIGSCEFLGQLPNVSAKSPDEGISAETAEALNHGLPCSCKSLANESVSSGTGKEVHSSTSHGKAETSHKSVTSSSDPLGSLGGDLKACIHQISADISGDISSQHYHFYRRGRARGRLRNPSSMKMFALKSLYSFRYFCREPASLNIGMMNGSEYCYPRFAELQARRNTLKDCTDPQLNGYEFEELAHAGWYFNRRTLVTFCCGMEMPMTPNGHPLDVHLGLSPQCGFARQLKKPPVGLGSVDGVTGPETLSAEQCDSDSLEASGGVSELRFSVPVQATEDVSAGYGVSSEAYDVAGFGLLQGAFQESVPGEHYSVETDSYALAGAGELSGVRAYMENLVTSTTPLASERFQPFSGNPNPAQQRPAGTMQNALQASGRLFMRGNVQDPLGSARLLRDLEGDNGRRSPPDFAPADQINIDGRRDNYRARYPQFGFPTVRNWTFEGWPRTHAQTPSMLADAGFFYAGYGDSVLCYSCGIGVRHWLPMDDPWIEHARWHPSCAYVEAIQGQEFIDAAVELTRNNRHPTYAEVRLEANRRRRAADAGINEEDAAPAAVPGEDETSMLCKVCYQEEMDTVLMPCRHLAVCQACSGRVGTCPICRTHIESTFRANFG